MDLPALLAAMGVYDKRFPVCPDLSDRLLALDDRSARPFNVLHTHI